MDYYEPTATEWERDLLDLRRRLLKALAFIVLVMVVGIAGFSVIDPTAGIVRTFFMTAITLTTVGFGEEIAVDSDGARMFTATLILVGMGGTLHVVITLTARQLNPRIRIVSRIEDVDQEGKIRKVGADAVVSPQHIGGLRLASELIRPTVVTFLDQMLRDRDENLRVDEILIPPGAPRADKEIRELALTDHPGVLLLAIRDADGSWEYNPRKSQHVRSNSSLIFLGTPEDSKALRRTLGGVRATDRLERQ